MPDINLSLKVPAIEKLIDYGASGVGAIAGPWLASWKASREGKARLVAAEADAGVRQIQARADANTLNIISEAQAEARAFQLPSDADVHGTLEINRQDIAQSIEFQGRKRLANTKAVLEGAANELGDKEVADHEPDPDWTARFFDCVQDVSSEDMQKIWAKILAGEVESPGRTSLRTLDTLRNMTKRDAEMFSDICPFVIGDGFVFYDDSVKALSALALSNLLHLEDCDLVNLERGLESVRQWREENYIVLDLQRDALMVTSNGAPGGPLRIPVVRLTSSGRELGRLSPQTVSMDYLRAFSKFLMSKDCRLDYLAGVESLPGGMQRYTNRILIEPKSEQVDGPTP